MKIVPGLERKGRALQDRLKSPANPEQPICG